MARIIGGIGTSHVPTIAMAFDKGKQDDPDWKPLFKGYEPVAKWLAEKKPDVLFFCFNDHATTFFFDHYPTFALGVSDEYRIADEGLGVRNIPPLKGNAALSRHIARSLVADEFDLTHVPGPAARPRPALAAHHDVAEEPRLAGRGDSAGGERAAAAAADAAAVFQAWESDPKGDRDAIRRTSRSRWSAPAGCRTR